MRADIVPAGKFPGYELTDHTKKRRRLSDLQGNDPMILVLARGHYCPKDQQQHLQLAASQPQIAVAYTRRDLDIKDVHRPVPRPDGAAHARPQARARDPQCVQRLLVLGPAVDRGSPPRPARSHSRDPSGLGPRRARTPRGVGGGRPLELLPRRGPGSRPEGRVLRGDRR